MGQLTFALNVTLDGCYDHRIGLHDEEMHAYWTAVMDGAEAMLFGRTTYEMMESHWPQVARDPQASATDRAWAQKLDAKRKYVVSRTRSDFPWSNTQLLQGDLAQAIAALKQATPGRVLLGSPQLSTALQRLDLIDEYLIVRHPVVAGQGPYLFAGLEAPLQLELVETTRLRSGIVASRYRRR